jgi:SSS family solute:Na+ symporter
MNGFLFGFTVADIVAIVLYFVAIMLIGYWAMKRIKNQVDYFLGGRRFGKIIQIFAVFGMATSAESATTATSMISQNGAAGVVALMLVTVYLEG